MEATDDDTTTAPDYVLDEIEAELDEDDYELDLRPRRRSRPTRCSMFLNEAGRYPLLTAAEEVELAKRIERGDMVAKERMITSNLRLVVSIAKPLPDAGHHARRPRSRRA